MGVGITTKPHGPAHTPNDPVSWRTSFAIRAERAASPRNNCSSAGPTLGRVSGGSLVTGDVAVGMGLDGGSPVGKPLQLAVWELGRAGAWLLHPSATNFISGC